jgi:Cof subfamily protein (haloacid dehalogenase superfamily)
MIKLIASDMDGTLLDENSELPAETTGIVRQLSDRGVLFAVATGRRYDTACAYFGDLSDSIDFVTSNGAQVVSAGEVVDREVFPRAALRRLRGVVDRFDILHIALFDRKRTFFIDDPSCYYEEFDKDLPEPHVIGWPGPDVNIIKASLFCADSSAVMDMTYILTRELGDRFVFAPSGSWWIDVLQVGVNKATGLRELLDLHGIDPSEVLAFGDSMNDYDMLRSAGESCAVANARPAIRQIATRTIGTNAEHAVQKEMRRIAEGR